MPSELRIIRFQLDEVTVAVKSLSSRMKMAVPEARILEAHVAPDGSSNTLLRYKGEEKVIPITNNQLAACLIAYCEKIKVPLPRKSSKSLHVSKEYMDMRIGMPSQGNMSESSVLSEVELDAGADAEDDTSVQVA